jgi:hypothetical protein
VPSAKDPAKIDDAAASKQDTVPAAKKKVPAAKKTVPAILIWQPAIGVGGRPLSGSYAELAGAGKELPGVAEVTIDAHGYPDIKTLKDVLNQRKLPTTAVCSRIGFKPENFAL